jgi:hypothetical protein
MNQCTLGRARESFARSTLPPPADLARSPRYCPQFATAAAKVSDDGEDEACCGGEVLQPLPIQSGKLKALIGLS